MALAGEKRDLKIKHALEHALRVVRFEDGHLEFAVTDHAPVGLAGELSRRLEEWTGRRWMVVVAREAGALTIAEERQAARDRVIDDARAHPLVAAVLARFPGAEIVDVRANGEEPQEALYEDALSAAAIGAVPDPDEIDDDSSYDDGAPPITEDPNDYEED